VYVDSLDSTRTQEKQESEAVREAQKAKIFVRYM
jgi:hypothetical protein